MTTTAKAGGQRNAVKPTLRTQADLDRTGLVHGPHQRKGAALAGQQLANLAMEHARHVNHQPGHTIHFDGLGRFSQVDRELTELLIHGLPPGHIGR